MGEGRERVNISEGDERLELREGETEDHRERSMPALLLSQQWYQ